MNRLERIPLIIRVIMPILWYGLIFYLTELPVAGKNHTLVAFREVTDNALQDKEGSINTYAIADMINYVFRSGAHMFMFGVLGGLLYFVFKPTFTFKHLTYWLVIAFVGVLGWLDEIHQSFVPGRHARVEDVIKDVIGAIILLALVLWAKNRFVDHATNS